MLHDMKRCPILLLVSLCLLPVRPTFAQTSTEAASALPRLVRFGGTVQDLNGAPLAGVAGVTFTLYSEQSGGAPLWQETQNVTADGSGHYTALLGSTTTEGLPAELFNSEQARWVGVQIQGQPEQPRVLLVSVPYALKASDSDTLGGRPASAYLLAGTASSGQPEGAGGVVQGAQPAAMSARVEAAATPSFTSGGTTNYIAKFTDTTGDLGNSAIYQNGASIGINTTAALDVLDVAGGITAEVDGGPTSGPSLDLRNSGVNGTGFGVGQVNFYTYSGQTIPSAQWQAKDVGGFTADQTLYTSTSGNSKNQPLVARLTVKGGTGYVGIGTATPAATLDVNGAARVDSSGTATAAAGKNSWPFSLVGSTFNSGTAAAVAQTFQLVVEPVDNDSTTPSAALSLLYGSGTTVPAETGLKIANDGLITFAAGQTFPIVGSNGGTVTSVGSGAGLTGGPITTSGTLSIAASGVSNAMLANPSLSVFAGTDLTGGGSVTLGGSTTINLDTTKIPQLSAANTFTANQTVNGSVTATSFSGNGSALTNLQSSNVQGAVALATNALNLGGLAPSAYATTGSNTFTGDQSVTGNVTATGGVTASGQVQGGVVNATTGFDIGGVAVVQASSGSKNFSAGLTALPADTTGTNNTAVGDSALAANTTGSSNTAVGYQALFTNSTVSANTAVGNQALYSNTLGIGNTATGNEALNHNTVAGSNTANGSQALFTNTNGGNNTASGFQALYSNATGNGNTANGTSALYSSTQSFNTALGFQALYSNINGNSNIAIGYQAGFNDTGNNNIHIGNQGLGVDSGTIRLGSNGTQTSTYIAGIYGVTTGASNAVPVVIDANGNLGTVISSRRFKEDIRDMGNTSSGLMRLRPVTFRYKKPYGDGSQPVQYGLIAEEVAEVYPDMVVRSADGQVETVKYQVLDPMLLNEVQKQHEQILAQERQIRSLEERLARMEAALASTR
jgi:hypothetical protein